MLFQTLILLTMVPSQSFLIGSQFFPIDIIGIRFSLAMFSDKGIPILWGIIIHQTVVIRLLLRRHVPYPRCGDFKELTEQFVKVIIVVIIGGLISITDAFVFVAIARGRLSPNLGARLIGGIVGLLTGFLLIWAGE